MKNKTIKRMCCGLLTTAMAATTLVGCGNTPAGNELTESTSETEQSTENVESSNTDVVEEGFQHDPNLSELGVEPICNEKIKLTVGVAQSTNVENFDTNAYTLMLEEMANVDIEFMLLPKAEAQTKIEMMVNAGGDELPDILILKAEGDTVYKWGSAGMLLPLNEYYENSSYYLAQKIEEMKEVDGVDIPAQLTAYDGNIYGTPAYSGSAVNPTYTATWVYTPWLEKLNIEVPKTTEEFYNMLEAFKTQDPNGNGKADEIPAMGSSLLDQAYGARFVNYCIDAFTRLNSFTYFLDSKDGQLSVSFTSEEFKEGVKYVKSLVEAGLYDPVSFSQNMDTFNTIMNKEGDQLVGCFSYTSDTFINSSHPARNNWTLIPPLTGPDGECNASYLAESAAPSAYITKNCENPEAAFRLLDLMYQPEVMYTGRWGIQGENWDYVADLNPADYPDYDFSQTFAGNPPSILEYKTIWNQVQNANWNLSYPALRTTVFTAGVTAASMKEGTTSYQQGKVLGSYYSAAPEEKLSTASFRFADANESTELMETKNLLSNYVWEKVALWCTGVADIDAEWDSYLKELERMGLSDWLAAMQTAYDR